MRKYLQVMSDGGLLPRIYKEHIQLINKKNSPVNGQKTYTAI